MSVVYDASLSRVGPPPSRTGTPVLQRSRVHYSLGQVDLHRRLTGPDLRWQLEWQTARGPPGSALGSGRAPGNCMRLHVLQAAGRVDVS